MPKVIDATTMWKSFTDIIKKFRPLSPYMIKGENNVVYMERDPAEIIESFAVLKNDLLRDFYVWAAVDINQVIHDLKEKDVKVKGTFISDGKESISVYKDSELQFTIDKVPTAHVENLNEYRLGLATQKYRLIKRFIPDLLKSEDWTPINESALQDLKAYGIGYHNCAEYTLMLPKRLYPLIKKEDAEVYMKHLQHDQEKQRHVVGIREEYPEFTLYSVVAIMITN